jgi:hypothetical protein
MTILHVHEVSKWNAKSIIETHQPSLMLPTTKVAVQNNLQTLLLCLPSLSLLLSKSCRAARLTVHFKVTPSNFWLATLAFLPAVPSKSAG